MITYRMETNLPDFDSPQEIREVTRIMIRNMRQTHSEFGGTDADFNTLLKECSGADL